jgi:hypothetical protein
VAGTSRLSRTAVALTITFTSGRCAVGLAWRSGGNELTIH